MKATLRIPAGKDYAYIECTVEGEVKEIVSVYNDFATALAGTFDGKYGGMDAFKFNEVMDNYLWGTQTMSADEYAIMNKAQQDLVQFIKRSRKRNK